MSDKRVLSGIQPTGNLHLGNYLGAIKNFVAMQNEFKCFFMLADLHALTVKTDPKVLKENILNTAATFLAAGLKSNKSTIFCQSQINSHTDLAWILNCIARVGWLNRMTQFKEKAGSNKENANIGLYTYPILMAADILIYKATHVPVGDDQKQHLELCRDIALKFNNDYKNNYFTLPEAIIPKSVSRIMSLRNGTKKMSKSEESDLSRINLTDTKDVISQKIKKAKTDNDTINEKIFDKESKRYEAQNLIKIYSNLKSETHDKVLKDYNGKTFIDFKKDLSDLVIEEIIPISNMIKKYRNDDKELINILINGSMVANDIAEKTIFEIKKIVGLA